MKSLVSLFVLIFIGLICMGLLLFGVEPSFAKDKDLYGYYVSFSPKAENGGDIMYVLGFNRDQVFGMEVDVAKKTLVPSTFAIKITGEDVVSTVVYHPCIRDGEIFQYKIHTNSKGFKTINNENSEEFLKLTSSEYDNIYNKVADLPPPAGGCESQPTVSDSYSPKEIRSKIDAFLKHRY